MLEALAHLALTRSAPYADDNDRDEPDERGEPRDEEPRDERVRVRAP